jgi:ABC-type glycerol-3-phosphate transport system substrate-binding protein
MPEWGAGHRRKTGMRIPLKTATLAVAAAALGIGAVACGGDDDGASGSDDEYVEAYCGAILEFQEDFIEAVQNASGDESPEEQVEIVLGPLEAYLDNLKEANPPADVAEYHGQVVAATEEAIDRIQQERNLDSLADLEPEPPPEEIQGRLSAAAADNETCQEAEVAFE